MSHQIACSAATSAAAGTKAAQACPPCDSAPNGVTFIALRPRVAVQKKNSIPVQKGRNGTHDFPFSDEAIFQQEPTPPFKLVSYVSRKKHCNHLSSKTLNSVFFAHTRSSLGPPGASSPQQACAPLTLHACVCVCVPFQGMFSLRAMYAMQCIHHCVFLFCFCLLVCCCSLVAAGTCKADKHPTQPGICIEHMLVEEEEEKREG